MPESRFTGKQVFGIVIATIVLLGLGFAAGGLIGYRWGQADGAQQTLAKQPLADSQLPAPQGGESGPRQFQMPAPFGDQLPAVNPGGPYLGVEFEMITPQVATREGITGTTGAIIRGGVDDGPAATAGLKTGDVITAVDGKPVDATNDLRGRVQDYKPDDEMTLTVVKGTASGPVDSHDIKVKLGERPAQQQDFGFQIPPDGQGFPMPFGGQGQAVPQQPAANSPYLGVEFEMIMPAVAAREAITGTTGALIKAVMADSPAVKAGLKKGDVITAVDGKPIDAQHTLRDYVLEYKVGDEITLTIVKGTSSGPTDSHAIKVTLITRPAQRQFQLPPGLQPGASSPDTRSG